MFKKICNALGTVVVVLAVLLAIALAGVRLFGFLPYAVLSPSMTPKYHPGDLIYVKATAPEEIQVGDAITFMAGEDKIVTHRVCDADREGRTFTTKGDANQDPDASPVLYENVIGVVRFSLPKLGYVSDFLASETGRWILCVGIGAMLLLFLLPELFRREKPKKQTEEDGKDGK